jgi:MFS transporter, DHA3 family, macrolide efflux protein
LAEAVSHPKGMRTFTIIWLGELISVIGSGLTGFALAVWVYTETQQATPFAITILLANLPRLLLAPLAGSLADRWNRRWLMILADLGSALTTLAAVIVLFFGDLQIWHIYLLVIFSSICGAFQEPAYMASVTMLVPKKDLARASRMMQLGQAIDPLITPLLAGVLFTVIGLRGIFLIDFITFFFAIGALLLVRIPQPKVENVPGREGQRPSLWSDSVFGWRYLAQRAGLFGLLWYFALVNFLLNFAMVLLGPLILSYSNATSLGFVQMAAGAGMLVGSIAVSVWRGPQKRIPMIIGVVAIGALAIAITGLRASVLLSAAGIFLLMLVVPLSSANSQALFQSKVAPGIQGRVFAIRTVISRSMMPLAFLLAGPLADHVFGPLLLPGGALQDSPLAALLGVGPGRGIGLMFLISGILLLLVTVAVFANPRIRNLEEELPDVVDEQPPAVKDGEVRPAAADANLSGTSPSIEQSLKEP